MLVTDYVCSAVMCSSQTIVLVADSVRLSCLWLILSDCCACGCFCQTVVLVAASVRLSCLWLLLSDYRACG